MSKLSLDKLKGWRLRKGWTLQQMADTLQASGFKISKAALGQFEKGKTNPKAATLRAIALAFGIRPSELLQSSFTLDFIGFRSLASLSKTKREKIKSIMVWRGEKREKLVEASGSTRRSWTLDQYRVESVEQADEIALTVRERWDLGLDAIGSLADVFETHGAEVIEIAEDSRFSGLSAYSNDTNKRPYIAVQHRDRDGARQRMDLAHELAHLVLDTDSPVDEEKFAHSFAGAFLLPRDVVVTELGTRRKDLSLLELKALKVKYGVSIQGWVRRSRDCGIISEQTYKSLCIRISKAGMRTDEGAPHVLPEAIDRNFRLAARAVTEKALTPEDAATLAGIKVEELAEPGTMQHKTIQRTLRELSRKKRRKLAEIGGKLSNESYDETPEDLLPDVVDIFED